MANRTLRERLAAGDLLVADGATGTNMQERGLALGMAPEVWLYENPAGVVQLHRDFIAAGSNILLTDTFGGTSLRLAHAGLQDKVNETNRLAVSLAREAAGSAEVLVAGSMGPTGQLLEPLGELTSEKAVSVFAEQARALAEAGADLLVIETQFDLGEATNAIKAARGVTTLPIVCSFSYDMGHKTMMGLAPAQVATELTALGVDVVGVNCGRSLPENLDNLRTLRQNTTLPLWMKPNAGLPHMGEDHHALYDVTPGDMGEQAALWLAAGASIIGGCCGSTPEHLRQIAQAVAQAQKA